MNQPVRPTLGGILAEMGVVEKDHLEQAAAQHRPRKLGEVLVCMGLVSQSDLDVALEVQRYLRKGQDARAAMVLMRYRLRRVANSVDRQLTLVSSMEQRVGTA